LEMYPGTGRGQVRPDDLQLLRIKQIESLRQFFPNVKELRRDSQYEIAFSFSRTRLTVVLQINLQADFPRVPPTIIVSPVLQHPMVDPQGFLLQSAHENLLKWTVHASLGKTVYEIIQKLMRDSPTPVPTTFTTLGTNAAFNPISGGQQSASIPLSNYPPTSNRAPLPSVSNSTSLPSIPSEFPELKDKSQAELTLLLSDDNELKKFFDSLSIVGTMRKVKEDLRARNEVLARENLQKEAEIDRLKRELITKQQTLGEKRNVYDSKYKKQQEIMKQFSPSAMIEKLGLLANEAEMESEQIANQFINDQMDYREFVKLFMEKRKLYHLRSAKRESLIINLRQQ